MRIAYPPRCGDSRSIISGLAKKMACPPNRFHKHVRALCKSIATGTEPVFLQCRVLEDSKINECFVNVDGFIRIYQGSIQYGWVIWEIPNVYIEAEFHAVWRSPENELLDVSPNIPPYDWNLFLPDPKRKNKGFQIDNIRRNICGDILIDRFFDNAKKLYKEKNKGEFKHFHGEMEPWPERLKLVEEKTLIEKQMMHKYGHILEATIRERMSSPLPNLSYNKC